VGEVEERRACGSEGMEGVRAAAVAVVEGRGALAPAGGRKSFRSSSRPARDEEE